MHRDRPQVSHALTTRADWGFCLKGLMTEDLRKLFAARLAKAHEVEESKAARLLAIAQAHARDEPYSGALTGDFHVGTAMHTMLLYAEVAYHTRGGRAGGATSHREIARRLETDSVMAPELRKEVLEHVRSVCKSSSEAQPSAFQQAVFRILQVRAVSPCTAVVGCRLSRTLAAAQLLLGLKQVLGSVGRGRGESSGVGRRHIASQGPSRSLREPVLWLKGAVFLQDMGTKPVQEYLTPDGIYSIDIALFVRGGTRVAIEVDGPSHFATNDQEHVLGDTVARRRVLVACGWVVISVPFYVWQRMPSTTARAAWLQRMLVGAVRSSSNGAGAASEAAAAAGGVAPALPTDVSGKATGATTSKAGGAAAVPGRGRKGKAAGNGAARGRGRGLVGRGRGMKSRGRGPTGRGRGAGGRGSATDGRGRGVGGQGRSIDVLRRPPLGDSGGRASLPGTVGPPPSRSSDRVDPVLDGPDEAA